MDLDEDNRNTMPIEAAVVFYNSQSQSSPYSSFPTDCCDDGDDEDFELQEEEDQEIGARKRGRKRGRKNKTKKEREDSEASQRKQKNSQERKRVKSIRLKYNELRTVLGFDTTKKLCKQKILDAAIDYIAKLQDMIKDDREEEPLLLCDETIPSIESSSSSTESSSGQSQSCLLSPRATAELSPVPFSYGIGRCPAPAGLTPSLCSPPQYTLMELYNGGWRATPEMDFPCNVGVTTPPATFDSYTCISPPPTIPLHHHIMFSDN